MIIQVHTDNHIKGSERMAEKVKAMTEDTLGHLTSHITRLEIHVSDENSSKGGAADKRCKMEARLKEHQSIAVSDDAEIVDQAIAGAADKLKSAIDRVLGKLHDRRPNVNFNSETTDDLLDDE
ncbi:MAG: HPF/RaiA family ribosome-associated protein [Pseudomonadota bacterium]